MCPDNQVVPSFCYRLRFFNLSGHRDSKLWLSLVISVEAETNSFVLALNLW